MVGWLPVIHVRHRIDAPELLVSKTPPNKAVRGTAARVRFGINVKGCIWAAARDGKR